MEQTASFNNRLYREVSSGISEKITITLIPYFAWGNRGTSEMAVWIPVSR